MLGKGETMFNKKRHVVLVNDLPKEKKPAMALDKESKFKWTACSDIMATWKKHGFVPPTEYRDDYLFKLNREVNKPNE
jgi:hypothetical protein